MGNVYILRHQTFVPDGEWELVSFRSEVIRSSPALFRRARRCNKRQRMTGERGEGEGLYARFSHELLVAISPVLASAARHSVVTIVVARLFGVRCAFPG
jgi:hypothetical protein